MSVVNCSAIWADFRSTIGFIFDSIELINDLSSSSIGFSLLLLSVWTITLSLGWLLGPVKLFLGILLESNLINSWDLFKKSTET